MKFSFRIAGADTREANSEDALIGLIKKYPHIFDEIAFFTDLNEQCYESIESMKKNAENIKNKIKKVKDAGVGSVGINILNTIGQNDDAWDWMEKSPYQTMVGHDGKTTTGSICMRADGFREYMKEKYRIYASAEPDFIWADDDMRIDWHGTPFPCFCNKCVDEFSKRVCTKYTRESLVDALDSDTDGHLRYEWIKFNADEMASHFGESAKSARKIKPDLRFGLMTIGLEYHFDNLVNFEQMISSTGATMLRPGGGFWTGEEMREYFSKGISVAFQIENAKGVADIQYESETIPHLRSKPVKLHETEATACVMNGCTGIAYDNVRTGQIKYFEEIVKLADKNKNLLERIREYARDTYLSGGMALYTKDAAAKTGSKGFFPSSAADAFSAEKSFFEAGFPYTASVGAAEYFVLSGDMVNAFSSDDLKEIFKKAVIADDGAIKNLLDRGMGYLCGCEKMERYTNGIKEVYVKNDLCKDIEGFARGGGESQFRGREGIYIAQKISSGAEVISECRSITGEWAGYASYIYENSLGGRVAALCYAPWTMYDVPERVALLREVVKRITRGRASFEMQNGCHILPIFRKNAENSKFVIMLTNAWLDECEEFFVSVTAKSEKPALIYLSEKGEYLKGESEYKDGKMRIKIPSLKSWETAVVFI